MEIYTREQLIKISGKLKVKSKTVGYTSGTFDILHPGHIDYLEKAKAKCDVLIVGVNSDSSVKSYKNKDRPVNPELVRAKIVSSLRFVDYTFIFSEKNNQENIKLLKPNFYFKGGDYKPANLTSAEILKSNGGQVVIIPFLEGYSTTSLIDQIQSSFINTKVAEEVDRITYNPAPALFLDRDGTIIEEIPYLHKPDQLKFVDGALDIMKKAMELGYRLIVVTNQPGIGIGYYTKEDFFAVNAKMLQIASNHGVLLDKIYFCGHSKADQCSCRKPNIGMLEKGLTQMNIIRDKSIMVGDMTSDILAGKRFGCKTVLVRTGKGGSDRQFDVKADYELEGIGDLSEYL